MVHSILDFSNIECIPCCGYKMGRPDVKHARLIKVLLPSSKFQEVAVRRASRPRSFFHNGVFLRLSLTKEERERRREKRLAKKQPSSINNIDASNLNANVNGVKTSVSHSSTMSNSVIAPNHCPALPMNASASLSQPQGNV